MFYTSGHDFFSSYQQEAVNLTAIDATAALTGVEPILNVGAGVVAATTGYTLLGQINPYDILKDNGSKKGYGAGSRRALYNRQKGHAYEANVPVRITPDYGLDFVNLCLLTAPGTGAANGLPELALAFGASTAVELFRFSVCNQLAADFREGQDSELAVTASMIGVYEDSATLSAVPTLSQLRDLGSPYTWQDITDFTIDGVDFRKHIGGISFNVNHNVERKGWRDVMVGAGAKASRCTYELLPHTATCTGELILHKELLKTSDDWGDIEIIIGETVWTLTDVVPDVRRQPGGDAGTQLGWTVPFEFDYLTVAAVV